ncbi:MAG: HAD family phosphatase [Magnetococcus sp. WYHC-3]
MTLALFDLDNTLLNDDCDFQWGQFLIDKGLVDRTVFEETNKRFYEDYRHGRLDMAAYVAFQVSLLQRRPLEEMERWRQEYLDTRVAAMILPQARELLADHAARGHTLVIITATNDFIAAPVAARLGVPHLLATALSIENGRILGPAPRPPCFQEGKYINLMDWLSQRSETLEGSWFYSDSRNDIPLLERVDHPVAVDPDPALRAHAVERGWPVISLRS